MMRAKAGQMAAMFALMLVTLFGCAGADAPQPVTGTVTVKGGGPLAKGIIRFTNTATKKSAVGEIEGDGTFKLSSGSGAENDGAAAGEYSITVAGTESGGGYDDPNGKPKKLIDDKYDTDATSDLKLTVTSGKNDFTIELDPAKK